MKTLNLTAFNAENVSKAIKAESFVTKIVNLGKNAQVLNQVLKAVKGKKSNATLDFFVIDGLQDALLNKALSIHNQDSAAKACRHDNYAQYLVTPKDTIVSVCTGRIMKWNDSHKERSAILALAHSI